ncbi:hypothetical protein [Moraxella lacunata]
MMSYFNKFCPIYQVNLCTALCAYVSYALVVYKQIMRMCEQIAICPI